ncbi:MAG: LamG domain-containing protein [Planctomycetota bacterium]
MYRKLLFLASVVLMLGCVSDKVVADHNLIAYWSFDNAGDPGHDDSGNGRDLTISGAAAYTAGGRRGGAITFPGQNTAYLEDDDGESYLNGLDAVSVAMWIKSGETNSDRGFFTTRDPAGSDPKQCLGIRYDASGATEDRVIRYYVMTTEDKGQYESPGEIQSTGWQHVAITWSASTGRSELYLDAELQELSRRETASGAGEPLRGTVDNAATVRIGIGYKNLGWLGLADEVRIYDYAMLPAEVLHLFDPNLAWNPSPRHRAENLCPDVELNWSPGDNAAVHDIYFGSSLSDVNESATAVRQAHDTNSYPVSAELGKTYYWRIDEVNGVDTRTGKIWNFATNDGNAFDPYPADGQSAAAIDPTLRWTPGCSATSHDVYFGTSWEQVNTMTDPCATKGLGDENYNPDTLDYLTWYYWRVDEVNDANTWRGQVWSFKTESGIIDPNMLLWFEFDEMPGDPGFVRDSSGYNYHGYGDDFDEDTWDANDGCCYAGSLNMDSDQRVDITAEVLDNINREISISVWLKGASRPGNDNWLFGSGSNDYHLAVAMPDSAVDAVIWQAGNDSNDSLIWEDASPEAWLAAWHHFVFIKNENTGTMSIWFDGSLADSIQDVNASTLANVKGAASDFRIGANWENNDDFIGRVDDFRIFDHELYDVEIRSLFRCGNVEKAWSPDPYDGELDVPWDVVLTWSAGDYAAYHDVYLGTAWDDVNDANTSSSEYKGSREPNEYDPNIALELGATYYWRIDEVNDPNVWRGNIWKFTVANYVIIDDFESYNDTDNRVYYTWEDGVENGNGSSIDLGNVPFAPAHGGDQSMLYLYNNTVDYGAGYYSEAQLPFDSPQDFTNAGVKALTLYFYGDPDNDVNDTDQLYVGLGGSYAEVRYGDNGEDMNDLKLADWTEWNIPVADFCEVDPCAVTSLFIGFGDRGSSTPGGDGLAYFDDVRLYPPRCVPQFGPALDFSGNCIVDWADIEIMANEWLRTDANLNPVAAPDSAGLVGWWTLDEGAGGNAFDDSGKLNDGTIEGDYSWVAGRIGPYALEFSGDGGRVLVPDTELLRPTAEVSVSAWACYSVNQGHGARIVVKGADNVETFGLEINDDDAVVFYVRDANDGTFDLRSEDIYTNEWMHLAGTYDGDGNTVKVYVNGREVDSREDATFVSEGMSLSQDVNDLAIGNRSDDTNRQFIGKVDDVRVYNYGLSAAEVAYLATEGTGYVPLVSQVNLYDEEPAGQKAINFRDITLLLQSWLEEELWPE